MGNLIIFFVIIMAALILFIGLTHEARRQKRIQRNPAARQAGHDSYVSDISSSDSYHHGNHHHHHGGHGGHGGHGDSYHHGDSGGGDSGGGDGGGGGGD